MKELLSHIWAIGLRNEQLWRNKKDIYEDYERNIKKIWRNMKKIWRNYSPIYGPWDLEMNKYEGIMKDIWRIWKKYEGTTLPYISRGTWKNFELVSLHRGGGFQDLGRGSDFFPNPRTFHLFLHISFILKLKKKEICNHMCNGTFFQIDFFPNVTSSRGGGELA